MGSNPLKLEEHIFFDKIKVMDFSKHPKFKSIQDKFLMFWESNLYYAIGMIIGIIAMLAGYSKVGMTVCMFGCSLFLIFCEDILATTFPFVLTLLMSVESYNNLGVYKSLWWVAIIFIVCFIIHIVIYRKPIRVGKNFKGFVCISIATLVGGIGSIPKNEYFSPLSLYYMFALGSGMLITYLIVKSNVPKEGKFLPIERFCRTLYMLGFFMGFLVLLFYYQHHELFDEGFTATLFPHRNYCATILLICMAVPCYFILRSNLHLISIAFMYVTLLMTGSRSGMFFGSLLLVGVLVYLFKYNIKYRKIYLMILLIGAVPFIVLDYEVIKILFESRLDEGRLIYFQDSRIEFFRRALTDFFDNPVFGSGLGNTKNLEVFPTAVAGSMVFYHNYFAQIIGSMGIVGVVAYGIMLYERMHVIVTRFSEKTAPLVLAYVGIFLISMLNPGEFGPIPNEMLIVMIVALIEDEPIVKRSEKTGERIEKEGIPA